MGEREERSSWELRNGVEGGKDGCRKSPQELLHVARPQAPFPRAASAAACSDPLVQRVVAFTAFNIVKELVKNQKMVLDSLCPS